MKRFMPTKRPFDRRWLPAGGAALLGLAPACTSPAGRSQRHIPIDKYDAVKDYNIVLYLDGHSGTGVRDWAPEGENKTWLCINDGQDGERLLRDSACRRPAGAAQRSKANVKVTRNPDRSETRQWAGEWEWKWLVDKKIEGRGGSKIIGPSPRYPRIVLSVK